MPVIIQFSNGQFNAGKDFLTQMKKASIAGIAGQNTFIL
jgi:hypothetical protein